MSEVFSQLVQLLDTEAVGWTLIAALLCSVVWIIVQRIKSDGEIQIAKESAQVSLNEQGTQLVLQIVETLREEGQALKERNASMGECIQHNERLCELLIAILSAPDEIMREHHMVRARRYLIEIGKWPKEME